MCGLFFVAQRTPVSDNALALATADLRHRGPDAEHRRVWQVTAGSNEGGRTFHLGAGHTRLSILDLDSRSNQPFARGQQGIIYNGEVYNYRVLRSRLRHVNFTTGGDTEVLFESMRCFGPTSFSEISGMWSFIYWDDETATVTASRDRYGKKPLFYYLDEETICFASEVKAISRYLGRPPALKAEALQTYLRHDFLFPGAADETHWEDIRQVRPGHYLELDLSKWTVTETRWFDPLAQRPAPPPDELADRLSHAVTSRLVSDRPVGLLLSGGVDSSLILSVLASNNLLDRVQCYFGRSGYGDDADLAKECVDEIGVAAREIRIDEDPRCFRENFLAICRHQEKPFPFIGNVFSMAQMYRSIRQHGACVALDGTGADEIFCGYAARFLRFACRDALSNLDLHWLWRLHRDYRPHSPQNKIVDEQIIRALRGRSPDKRPSDVMARYAGSGVLQAASSDPLQSAQIQTLSDALSADTYRGRLLEFLWHADRNAMMASVENRSPFLDNVLTPYIYSPYSEKWDGLWNKMELRKAFSRFVELPTQWRPLKQGFGWNSGSLLAGNADWIIDMISGCETLRDHVNVDDLLSDLKATKPRVNITDLFVRKLLCIAGLEEAMGG